MTKFCTLLLAALAVATLPSLVTSQIVLPGDCPKYATQTQFNPAQVNISQSFVFLLSLDVRMRFAFIG